MTAPDTSPWTAFKALVATPALPALGPGPRPDRLPPADLDARLESFCSEHGIGDSLRAWLRGAALLWHDHLDASHRISQQLGGVDASFLHGIMHRRETDYRNATYWFHRVGRHEAFREIARQTTRHLVRERHADLLARLAPNGLWNPFAFIDLCEESAAAGDADPRRPVLQRVQEWEFDALLQHRLGAVAGGGPASSPAPAGSPAVPRANP